MFQTLGLALTLYSTFVVTYLGTAFVIDMSTIYRKIDRIRTHVSSNLSLQELLDVKILSECKTIKDDLYEYAHVAQVVFYNLFKVLPIYTIIISYMMLSLKDYYWSDPFILRNEIGMILISSIISDVFFYSYHRYFHMSAWWFKYIHYMNHEHQTNAYSIQSQYCHPLEFVLNMTSFSVGILLTNLHVMSVLTIMVYSIMMNLMSYTNKQYKIGTMVVYSSSYHQFHHNMMTVNFGIMYLSDYLYKTLKL